MTQRLADCGDNDKVLASRGRSKQLTLAGETVGTNNQPSDKSGDDATLAITQTS